LVTQAIKNLDRDTVTTLIDNIKDLGFEAATISGISVSVSDCEMIPEKNAIIATANKKAVQLEDTEVAHLNNLLDKLRG